MDLQRRRQIPRLVAEENPLRIQYPPPLQAERTVRPSEFLRQHLNVIAQDVVARQIRPLEVTLNHLRHLRKRRRVFHVLVRDPVDRRRLLRNRHARIQQIMHLLRRARRLVAHQRQRHDAVGPLVQPRRLQIENRQRTVELQAQRQRGDRRSVHALHNGGSPPGGKAESAPLPAAAFRQIFFQNCLAAPSPPPLSSAAYLPHVQGLPICGGQVNRRLMVPWS